MFTREISSRNETRPGTKSCLSVLKCLLLFTRFLPRWNLIPGWTHPCQKGRDEISSRDEKKKKRRVNISYRDEILKWACFFNFRRMCSNMLSKVNVFEHNGRELWKEKGWEQQVKNQKCKNIFIISIIFFVKFRKDWNFLLL